MSDAPRRTSLRGPLLRFALLVLLLAAGFVALRWSPLAEYLDRERLVALFRTLAANPWAPAVLVGCYLVLVPLGVPVSPFILAGGLVFGFGWGAGLNILGTWAGAALSFLLGRLLGRDFIEHLLGGRLRLLEEMVERHGFWTLVRIRFIPIPFALVNYAAALAGVRPAVFLGATALGLAPSVAVYTYFVATLFRLAAEPEKAGVVTLQLIAALAGLMLLSFLPKWLGWGVEKR